MARSTCGACKSVFFSVSAFDMHRVGRFEPLERRCLSADEMRAKGMALKNGIWNTGSYDTSWIDKSKSA
jgi:hypothetical protein